MMSAFHSALGCRHYSRKNIYVTTGWLGCHQKILTRYFDHSIKNSCHEESGNGGAAHAEFSFIGHKFV